MDFDDYQDATAATAIYPGAGTGSMAALRAQRFLGGGVMTDLKVQHLLDGIDDAKDEVRVKRRFMRILISLALLSWASVVIGFFISHMGISVTMVIVGFIAGLLFSGFSSFAWADYRDSLPKIRQAERAHRDHLIREGHL